MNQTYSNIHVCVIDDCSEDKESVLDICQSIVGSFDSVDYTPTQSVWKSPTLTYIQLIKDKGSYKQAYARNRGIETCWQDTDIFAILDADDEKHGIRKGMISHSKVQIKDQRDCFNCCTTH